MTPDSYHPDELAFLAAVIANPGDDTARLVYADWLEDQGQSDRARYIRWRILGWSSLGLTGSTSELLTDMAQQEADSIRAFCDWAGPELAPFFREKRDYERGLLHSVSTGGDDNSVARLLGHCDRLFRLAPVRTLSVGAGSPGETCSLLHRPELSHLDELTMGPWCWVKSPELVLDALITSPHLGNLRTLNVQAAWSNDFDDETPRDQLSPDQWDRLRERFGGKLCGTPPGR